MVAAGQKYVANEQGDERKPLSNRKVKQKGPNHSDLRVFRPLLIESIGSAVSSIGKNAKANGPRPGSLTCYICRVALSRENSSLDPWIPIRWTS
jgi:hypothetical protein